MINLIPHCFAMGQAAGAAAAVALRADKNTRYVEYRQVQEALREQNVYLP